MCPAYADARHFTTRLADLNPERFKDDLIAGLGNPRIFSSKAFATLGQHTARAWKCLNNLGQRDKPSILLDTSDWVSHNGTKLKLGIRDIPPSFANSSIFLNNEFSGDKSILWRFSHELSHSISSLASNEATGTGLHKVYLVALNERTQDSSRGLTSLGSQSFYRNQSPVIQATEDLTELVNMYLLSEKYFDAYIEYLGNQSLFAHKHNCGIVSDLDPVFLEGIKATVPDAINQLFMRSGA